MTQKDIANEVGVSISTVSRVLNNKGKSSASPAVRERIWEIVRRTNYVPNDIAQRLRTGQEASYTTAAGSIECLFGRTPFSSKDQFFSELAHSVEVEALAHNYILQYSFSSSAILSEASSHMLSESNASGLIVLGRCDKSVIRMVRKTLNKICYVGLNYSQSDYDQVICDGREASRSAVEYLIGLGHKKIGYIGEAREEMRYIGYRDAIIGNHLSTDPRFVSNVLLSYDGGYNGAKKLMTTAPEVTAVFCANDTTALGAMRAFQEIGMSIPKDISIIGVDDIEGSKYLTPPLTTIHIPIEEMGQHAVKLLVDRICEGHKTPVRMTMPYHLEVRETCGVPRKQSPA